VALSRMSQEPRAGTVQLTLIALGLVLGLSGAAALPLLFSWAAQPGLTASCVALAVAPFVGYSLLARTRRRRGAPLPSPHLLTPAAAVAVLAALALAPLFNVYRGRVRVLNHGDEPFVLYVDSRRVARVEPSSGESPLSGVELEVPAGDRSFRVQGDGASGATELFRARLRVEGGSPHLFAPLSSGYCFTIESRGYGDAREDVQIRPLEGDIPFWVLPDGIAWFVPNPEPGPLETSGGTLSCLRQKRCTN
jgi:hypothetical protein